MNYDNRELKQKVEYWKQLVVNSKLPSWDELPNLELYMDQVIVLINDYLSYIVDLTGDDKTVTPSMINNYVKMKVIPAPIKKRYSRIHLASLIMVCSLKKGLNISTVQKILPKTENEEEAKNIYNSFVENRRISVENAVKQVDDTVYPIINEGSMLKVCNLITRVAVNADLNKLFTEKITEEIFEEEQEQENDKDKEKQKDKKKKQVEKE